MIFLKEASAFFCTSCSHTTYISKQQTGQDPNPIAVDNSIAYVGNPTNSPRNLWIRNKGEPRSHNSFNKQPILNTDSGPDSEARAIAEKNNMHIVDYTEVMPKGTTRREVVTTTGQELKNID